MEKYKYLFILFLIILIGFFLRIWQLGIVPSSPNWDEVALGYNAYSILQTGRDEYGKYLPAVLRSYDDYKPAAYTYLVIPFVAAFGLSAFTVRLPAVLFATLAIPAVYFLVKELTARKKIEIAGQEISVEVPALVTAFLLSISPWHLQFSRIAFESNVGVAFNIFAVLFFLLGLRKPLFLLLSAFCFGFAPSLYQSDKVFTPIIVLAMVFIYRESLLKLPKKYIIYAVIIGLITIFPAAWFQLTDTQALARAQGVSIFADQTAFLKETSQRLLVDREKGDFLGLVFDNRRVEFLKAIIAGYISHFSLNWLFVHGDLPRHHAPNTGLLYLWELPFLFIGIYTLLFGKLKRQMKILIFVWFLAAPIPASITSGVPHAVRTLNFLPTFQLFVAFGVIVSLIMLFRYARHSVVKKIFVYGSVLIYLFFAMFNIIFYLNEYFVQQNYYTSVDWQYGYKQAVAKVSSIEKQYEKIVVTNKPPLDQSYMFFLFYLQYPPEKYQLENVQNLSGGFRENHVFGKYEFRPVEWESEKRTGEILYVGRPEDFPEGITVIEEIKYLNNDPAIMIVSGKI